MTRKESGVSGRFSRRTVLQLVASGGGLALLAACSSATTPAASAPPTSVQPGSAPSATGGNAPNADNTLTVTYADLGSQVMDVIGATSATSNALIYEPLLQYDRQGNLMPWLAQSWSMGADGKLWTINLRQNVKWTNGDEFTSADVKFSLERYISPEAKNPWSPSNRQTIDHIETPDKYTVNIYAKDPVYVFYPDALTGTLMHPKNYFEKVGLETFSKQPLGTGPWKLTSFTPAVSAELEQNKDYWGDKSVWSKLVLTQAPEESTRVAMLKRGETDIVGVSIDQAVTLRTAGYQLRQPGFATIPAYFLPGYWMTPGPVSDGKIREAMDIAINRQELVDSFFKGFGKPGAGFIAITDSMWGFDPVWYSVTYEPDRAKQLLKDAGYPGNFTDPTVRIFSTIQGANGWEPDYAQVLAGYWQAVGLTTQLVPIDFTTMRSGWIGKDPKIMGNVVPYIGNSSDRTMAAEQNHMTSNGVNVGGNDPELDKNFLTMISELDPARRLALWQTIQQEAFALHSVVGLARVFDQYAVSDKVGDWTGLDYLSGGLTLGLTGVQHR
jgi:peptide/nickel transport system substrate-binding protein